MKKKFLGKTLRILTDDDYWDDNLDEARLSECDGVKIIEIGEWQGGGAHIQYRDSIVQDINTGKYYRFSEEAETAVDMFVTMWENWPHKENEYIECEEVVPKEITKTIWEKAEDHSSLFMKSKSIAESRLKFREFATGTKKDMVSGKVKISFRDGTEAEINEDTWETIRGW